MGQVLSHPIRSQLLQRRHNEHFMVASSEMQGCRMAMEDTHTIAMPVSDKHPNISLFAVFDGHAGDKASLYLEKEVHLRIGELDDPTDADLLTQAMVDIDKEFLSRENDRDDGSTCVFAILQSSETKDEEVVSHDLTVVNVGDSRVIIIRADGTCVPMTVDHKPETPDEKQRISDAGGTVQMNRVDGQLAMSRAIGDWQYKQDSDLPLSEQKVIAVPDVTKEKFYEGDSLLVCCDGIVEQMSNEDAATIVHENLPKYRDDPAEILCILFEQSLKNGSKDNHSALLILPRVESDYAREDEFRAGPFNPFKADSTFVKYYMEDAKKHGYEGEELMRLAAKTEESMPELANIERAPGGLGGGAQLMQILAQQPGEVQEKLMELLSAGAPVTIQQVNEGEETGTSIETVEPVSGEIIDTTVVEEGTLSQEDGSTASGAVSGIEAKQDDPPVTIPDIN